MATFSELAECPACHEMAEPEQDGDVSYFSCGCGMDFGYQIVTEDPSCQLGVPEDLRRAASVPSTAVDVQITRRPDVPA